MPTANLPKIQIFYRHGDIGRHESEALSLIMRTPIYLALKEHLGLEIESLEDYLLMDERMAEPSPEDGLSTLYNEPGRSAHRYRTAVWRVTKRLPYTTGYEGTNMIESDGTKRDPNEDELTSLYPYVPTVRYFIAGGAGPRQLYLCTKLAPDDRALLGLSYDTYPRMGYLTFSCSLDYIDGSLRIDGPAHANKHPDMLGWPDPDDEQDYSGSYLPPLDIGD